MIKSSPEPLQLVTGEPARLLLDVGLQPVCHKFLRHKDQAEERFPIKLGYGVNSGLVGLIAAPPWQALTPVYDWVVCNEPEDHLDDVADWVAGQLPDRTGSMLSLSSKDASLMARLTARGIPQGQVWQCETLNRLCNPGVEAVQALVPEQGIQGRHDLILARHILEHAQDPVAFLQALRDALTPQGWLLLEVPDNQKAFRHAQHTVIWEEHSLYFTELSLKGFLAEQGWQLMQFMRYEMALEDILIAIVRPGTQVAATQLASRPLLDEVIDFSRQFPLSAEVFRQALCRHREQGQVAMLGAGHLGASFINYYGLADVIDMVVDDDPNKQGLFMPGSGLPIVNSAVLHQQGIKLCLLTCNPWNNDKIMKNNNKFIQQGGVFLSVFQPETW